MCSGLFFPYFFPNFSVDFVARKCYFRLLAKIQNPDIIGLFLLNIMEQTLFESILWNPYVHLTLWILVFIIVTYIVSMKDAIVKFVVLIFGLPWFAVAMYFILDSLNYEPIEVITDFWYLKVGIPVAILIIEPLLFILFYRIRITGFRRRIQAGKKAGNPTLKFKKVDKKWNDTEISRGIILKNRQPDEKGQRKLNRDLRTACKERFPDLGFISALLEQGADVNSRDEEGLTAMHQTTDWLARKYRLILYLIRAGADPNIKDESGRTVLGYYTLRSHFKMGHFHAVEVLANYTDVNIQDNDGKTALFYRAGSSSDNRWSFLLLKKYRAEINIRDNQGKTALDYATEGNNRRLAAYLKRKSRKKS